MVAACPVFDAHFHIGRWGTQTVAGRTITPIPGCEDHVDGEGCVAYLRRYGIEAGLIVPTYLEDQTAAFKVNQLLVRAVEAHEGLCGGLWVSPMPEAQALNEEVLGALPSPGIRALKISTKAWKGQSIDPRSWTSAIRRNVEAILKAASDHGLVVHFHTGYISGSDPLAFEGFMAEYGSTASYQVVHMGEAIGPAMAFVPRFIDWIQRGCDVYTDTSVVPGFAPNRLVRELLGSGLGTDRVLFASDAPWGRFPCEYWKVEGLEVDDEVKHRIFWGNAARLYGLPRRVDQSEPG